MALPVTITGIATSPACVGPFKSSGGNFYFFGKDSATATTLQAYKATDPSSSWSSIATDTGFSTAVQFIAAYQSSDTIHLAVIDGATTSVNLKYRTFNMATDAFVTSETVHSAFNPQDSGAGNRYAASIVFRGSDSQPVILYNGPRAAVMGTSYSRVVYARRTGTNTWTTNVAVDAGGASDFVLPEAILGSSSRTHFFWTSLGSGAINQRALNSANTLQTASTAAGAHATTCSFEGLSYDAAGTQKILCSGADGTNFGANYFDSADTVTQNVGTEYAGTLPQRLFNDGTDVYALYRVSSNSDLGVRKSTDHGATFGAETNVFTATVAANSENLSRDGNIYQRGTSIVIPYVANDGGTLKYNEHTVRTVSGDVALSGVIQLTFTTSGALAGAAALSGSSSPSFTTAGSLLALAPLSGTSSVAFTTSGNMLAVAALSGTSSLAFTTAGNLVGSSALSAASSLTFTTTGVLAGAAALAGASSITFSPTGSLSAGDDLSGVSSLTFTTTGNLTGSAALSGASTLTFTPAGNLVGSAALSGASALTFTTAANLAGTSALSGSTALTFSSAGNLVGSSALAGTAGIAFILSGDLTAPAAANDDLPHHLPFIAAMGQMKAI